MTPPPPRSESLSWFGIYFSLISVSKALNMSWDDVCDVLEGIYVNWDPKLFKHKLDFHG
jgi:hypothetical protein